MAAGLARRPIWRPLVNAGNAAKRRVSGREAACADQAKEEAGWRSARCS